VNPKIQKRRMFIEANQAILKRKRQAEKEKMRGVRRLVRLPKVEGRRLENLKRGQWVEGQVARIVGHGAWVDVGSNVDGFLHVSAIRADGFVHHPADELTPGQPLRVRVKHVDAEQKVLGVTCLESVPGGGRAAATLGRAAAEGAEAEEEEEEADPFRARGYPAGGLPLEEVWEDQEMWGEVTRVTHFGAFMEVGLAGGTEAFLHVNDYPERQIGQWAPDVFKRGQRIRAYAKEVDIDYNRLKLTAARPRSLPRVPW
jgi:ribosomal protein S1